MGFRSRLRALRKTPTQAVPASEPSTPLTSSDMSSPSLGSSPVVAESAERVVEPVAERNSGSASPLLARPARFSRDSKRSNAPSTIPSSSSTRTSLLDAASRMRRTLREKVLLRKNNGDNRSDASLDVDDIPEISDADLRIAEYAAASSSMDGSQESSKQGPGAPDISRLEGVGCGDTVPLSADVPEGARCNDGYVSFVVPAGTARATEAAKALLETDRLQVMAAVSAVSSPIFVSDKEIQVDYSSHAGAGKGIAKFADKDGVHMGACVFALCGPTEIKGMLQRTLQDLSKSVILMSVPNDEARIDASG